jgi:hypothetical protein
MKRGRHRKDCDCERCKERNTELAKTADEAKDNIPDAALGG